MAANDSSADDTIEESYPLSFQCCVCLELLYKPVVLACGHISCFWCVHKAMHGLSASHCAMCRQPYIYFPSICQLLHNLLLKMEPATYKRREKEVLEEERRLNIFSPQFVDNVINETVPSEEIEESESNLKVSTSTAPKESTSLKSGVENGTCNPVSVNDAMCALCKELLFQPSVLNCGHVYCESCMSDLAGGPLKCPVCQSLHPGEFPNVCLDLDHFLQEQFPIEYALRKEKTELKIAQREHGDSSSSASQGKQNATDNAKDAHMLLDEDLHNVHVHVGCDSCGMYPIRGKRYRCKDCEEAIGFDLCEMCYNSSSKLPGRFNQQHTPDHKFILDESNLLYRILPRFLPIEGPQEAMLEVFLPGGDLPDEQDDVDNNNVME